MSWRPINYLEIEVLLFLFTDFLYWSNELFGYIWNVPNNEQIYSVDKCFITSSFYFWNQFSVYTYKYLSRTFLFTFFFLAHSITAIKLAMRSEKEWNTVMMMIAGGIIRKSLTWCKDGKLNDNKKCIDEKKQPIWKVICFDYIGSVVQIKIMCFKMLSYQSKIIADKMGLSRK